MIVYKQLIHNSQKSGNNPNVHELVHSWSEILLSEKNSSSDESQKHAEWKKIDKVILFYECPEKASL